MAKYILIVRDIEPPQGRGKLAHLPISKKLGMAALPLLES